MKGFTMGLVAGGMMTAFSIGYLLQDQKTYQDMRKKSNKMMRKGKRMAKQAEGIVEDAVDDLMHLQ